MKIPKEHLFSITDVFQQHPVSLETIHKKKHNKGILPGEQFKIRYQTFQHLE